MSRVVHFEIHADDPERTASFYKAVFGWDIQKWEYPNEHWIIITGSDQEPGINGALIKRSASATGEGILAYVCMINVPTIDQHLKIVQAAGGSVARAKTAIPDIGWLAYCKDTEGNLFGMMQNDAEAK